jgi:phage FluMu gp28-like protein
VDLEALSAENRQVATSRACYAGLDLAKHRDYSVLSVVYEEGEVLRHSFLHRFPLGTPYTEVLAYVQRAETVFRFQRLVVDQTGVGEPIVEELQRSLAGVEGVVLTAAKKEELLSRLKLRMEQRRLALVNYRPLITELNEQQYAYAQEGSNVHLRFTHPPGHHDDLLWSLALAVEAAQEDQGVVIPL